jgi:hypothetical protein
VQLEDDGSETATRLVEEVEASFEGLAFLRLVALVYGVVPDFPTGVVSDALKLRKAPIRPVGATIAVPLTIG